jgi:hypothetical protein
MKYLMYACSPKRRAQIWGAVASLSLVLVGCSFDSSTTNGIGSTDSGVVPRIDGGAGMPDAGSAIDSSLPGIDAGPPGIDAGPPIDAGSTSPVEPTGTSVESGVLSGGGGSPFGPVSCATGDVVIGIDADFKEATDNGDGFCHVKAVCGRLQGNGLGGVTRTQTTMVPAGSGIGNCGSVTPDDLGTLLCPNDTVVVGYRAIRSGLYNVPTQMQLHCGSVSSSGAVLSREYTLDYGKVVGTPIGPNTVDCPDPRVGSGIYGRSGEVIDALGLHCKSLATVP